MVQAFFLLASVMACDIIKLPAISKLLNKDYDMGIVGKTHQNIVIYTHLYTQKKLLAKSFVLYFNKIIQFFIFEYRKIASF